MFLPAVFLLLIFFSVLEIVLTSFFHCFLQTLRHYFKKPKNNMSIKKYNMVYSLLMVLQFKGNQACLLQNYMQIHNLKVKKIPFQFSQLVFLLSDRCVYFLTCFQEWPIVPWIFMSILCCTRSYLEKNSDSFKQLIQKNFSNTKTYTLGSILSYFELS